MPPPPTNIQNTQFPEHFRDLSKHNECIWIFTCRAHQYLAGGFNLEEIVQIGPTMIWHKARLHTFLFLMNICRYSLYQKSRYSLYQKSIYEWYGRSRLYTFRGNSIQSGPKAPCTIISSLLCTSTTRGDIGPVQVKVFQLAVFRKYKSNKINSRYFYRSQVRASSSHKLIFGRAARPNVRLSQQVSVLW